jgi:hypothetical protein
VVVTGGRGGSWASKRQAMAAAMAMALGMLSHGTRVAIAKQGMQGIVGASCD